MFFTPPFFKAVIFAAAGAFCTQYLLRILPLDFFSLEFLNELSQEVSHIIFEFNDSMITSMEHHHGFCDFKGFQ
jgi:hypothetical protein